MSQDNRRIFQGFEMNSAEDGPREGSWDDGIKIGRQQNIPGIFYEQTGENGARTC